MQTHRHPGLSAALARPLRHLALAAALALLAACAGTAPPPSGGMHRAEPVTVIVQRGDTLLAIARRHGVALSPLAAANGLAPPYVIRPGQVLHVPGGSMPLAPPVAVAASGSSLGAAAVPEPPAAPATSPPIVEPPSSRAVMAEALPPPGPPPPDAAPRDPTPQAAARTASPPAPAERATSRAAPAEQPRPREAAPPPRRMPPGRFAWPVQGRVVSGFGSKGGGLVNDGMNIAAPRGTPVRAAADGTVIYAGNEVRGFGNLVLVRHEGGWVTAYAHNERLMVRQGQAVRTGEEIARVGSTGAVGAPQLHFQVRRDGKPVDPAAYLDRQVAERSS
ncbi:MAG: M23 family metallopeptidase [Acetobacteraceae bacterium]|jgi:murein DD-endopeptidase MepM/ murein hydrolase activator NlpD|nr:M23 family metallopeptidase [Acetobacteraceae bacterium]